MEIKRPQGLVFVLITLFLDVMGVGFITPILPKLVTQLLGDDVSTASHYFGAIATTLATAHPWDTSFPTDFTSACLTGIPGLGIGFILPQR